jgi:FMN phosphatase YigB (HAD superfamily)
MNSAENLGADQKNVTLKAVIFDMDDTLLDWSARSQDWYEFEREHLDLVFDYLAETGHTFTNRELQFVRFVDEMRIAVGQAWGEAERTMIPPDYFGAMQDALVRCGFEREALDPVKLLDAYNWGMIGGVCAFSDAGEVLPLLRQHGVRVAMITNSAIPMRMRDRELTSCGLLEFFDTCRFSAADVGYLKPHPKIFEHTLNCLGCTAQEAVMVGDNIVADVHGAHSVGMRGVLRILSHRPQPFYADIVPEGTIHTLHDLLPLLDTWYPNWRSQTPVAKTESGESAA